jgi:hypothetical protein
MKTPRAENAVSSSPPATNWQTAIEPPGFARFRLRLRGSETKSTARKRRSDAARKIEDDITEGNNKETSIGED